MRVFLTGGTGFIGSHVTRLLLERGFDVAAFRRPGSLCRTPLTRDPDWVESSDLDRLQSTMEGCRAFLHLAAAGVDPAEASWDRCFEMNVEWSRKLWIAGLQSGIRHFVICGSCSEYGRSGESMETIPADAPLHPVGPYGASKAAASMAAIGMALEKKVSVEILRPFQVFGPGEAPHRLWAGLRKAAADGADFPMTPGEQVRDFVPVESVAADFVRALESEPHPGRVKLQNLGTGRPRRLLDFSQETWRHFGAKGKLKPGALPYRPNEVMRYVPDLEPKWIG